MPRWRCRLALALGPAMALACTDTVAPPSQPALEIVNTGDRLDAGLVNAHAYGSFRVDGGGGTPPVIASGPANFPGAPKAGAGTCLNGLWYNSQGKPTTGSTTKPHPHCIRPAAAIEVVLEPISACFTLFPDAVCPDEADKSYLRKKVLFGAASILGFLPKTGSALPPKTTAEGLITAYAIDATTLGTTNKRVGTVTFNFADYNSDTENYLGFALDEAGDGFVFTCSVDPVNTSPCLNKVISATYNPLPAPDGIGPTDFSVSGYLWLTPAGSPFNYSDMPIN